MPDAVLDRETIRQQIFGTTNEPTPLTATPAAGPTLIGPQLDKEEIRRQLNIPPGAPEKQPEDFVSRNYRGIPIDLEMQSPTDLKTSVLMRDKPADKISFLEGLVGKGNVRMADNGEPLVTVYDQKRGGPVEFRVLGEGPNIVAHAQAAIPETAAALAGMVVGKKVPTSSRFLKFASEMIGGAIGQETAGAAKDVLLSATPLDQIVEERASAIPKTAAANMAIGAVANLITKVGGKIMSPVGAAAGPVEVETMAARQHFLDKYGIDYPLTAGEKINSPLFKRVEATMSQQPGATANFAVIQKKKVEAMRQIQAKMLSSKLDPADLGMLKKLEEDVGDEAIGAIRQNVNPVVRAEETARNTTAQAFNEAILEDLAAATGPERQLYPERVGAKLRAGTFGRRQGFESESERLYGAAYALEGGKEKIIEPPNLVGDAKKLLKEQPTPEITTTQPSAIVGPTGQPLMVDVTGKEVLKEFVPEGIMPMLNRLSTLDRAKFSLQDLVKMRTEVRNSIKQGEAIPGVNTHYLGEIEDTLTKSINEGLDSLPTSDLKDAWKAANDFYAKNVQGFKDKNIARLFRDKETGAFVQDEDLVRNIGPSEYQSYKQFFGENSPEFGTLKRAIVDQLLPGEELINAKQFLSNLKGFIQKNRSVADDILGPEMGRRLQQIGEKLQSVQAGDVVDRNDIANLLVRSGKTKTLAMLDELVQAQRKLSDVYRSQIVKDIAQGRLGQTFNASEFVNRLWDSASPKEIAAIKEQLKEHPEILEDLQRKMAERVFEKAQRATSGMEPARVAAGEPFRKGSATSIENVFGNEQNKQRIRALVGDEAMENFEQLARLLRGSETAEGAFASAGGFSRQMQIQRMLRTDLTYLPEWLRQKFVAIAYFSKPIEKLLTNQIGRDPQAQANLARTIILSQPFMSAMGEDFGDKASAVVDKILDSIDLYEKQGPPGKAAVNRQAWVDQMLKAGDQGPNRQRVFPAPTNQPAMKGQ